MVETKAQLALLAYFAERGGLNQARLAAALGCRQPSVSAWARGHSRPESHHREAIERLTGIPQRDWMTASERAVADGVATDDSGPQRAVTADAAAAIERKATGT